MVRTETAMSSRLTIVRPASDVTFVFPDVSDSGERTTTIIIPARSKWSPSPHWHEQHAEYFRVIKGCVRLVVDGVPRVVGPEDGEQRIERYSVHEFMRADTDGVEDIGGLDEDVIVEERVDPADGLKEVFFRNIFSVIQDSKTHFGYLTGLQIIMTSAQYDNFDVYVEGKLRWFASHAVHVLGSLLGSLLGLRSSYNEYTPEHLREAERFGRWKAQ